MPRSLDARSLVPELMDDPSLDAVAHEHALRGLHRINRWSDTADSIWRPIERMARDRGLERLSILDVACADGALAIALAARAAAAGVHAEVRGFDMSERALALARARAAATGRDVRFFALEAVRGDWPDDVDFIVCSLFLHHLADDDIVTVLRRAADATRHGLVISDLRRTRRGLALARVGTRLLSRSPIVHADGPQSVRAALTIDELRAAARAAGLASAVITPSWPQRMLLTWSRH